MSEKTSRSWLESTLTGNILAIVGLALPIVSYVAAQEWLRNATLLLTWLIILMLVLSRLSVRATEIRTRRADPRTMDDQGFFRAVEKQVVDETLTELQDLADGYLRVYASEVPKMSILLYRTLTNLRDVNRHVLATDLTTDPQLLLSRRSYLDANRTFIASGGTVQRIFICREQDLTQSSFVRPLVDLIEQHRSIGVSCGLAVREQIDPTQAVDYVVFSRAAVLVEDEQGTEGYVAGRSTVHFKRVDPWRNKFCQLWEENETPAAMALMNRFLLIANDPSAPGTGSVLKRLLGNAS